MKKYLPKSINPGNPQNIDQIDFSNIRIPKLGMSFFNKSVQQLKKEHTAKADYERALKKLDISPNPAKYRNPFKSTPDPVFKSNLKRNKFLFDNDVQELIDAMFFRVNNNYLLVNKDFGAPIDFFTAEIQVRNLKKLRPLIHGVEAEDVDKTPLEDFWVKYISQDLVVRWDVFEEALSRYFIIYINQSIGKVRKINWDVFLKKLFRKISSVSNELELWPGHPGIEPILYQGKVVTLFDFQNCITSGKLKSVINKSIKQETFYITERYKKPVYTFACGGEYKGNWASFLRDGLSKLKLGNSFNYEGYFFKGLRHGFGVCKADNSMYKGYWDSDLLDGPGDLAYHDISKISGVWKKGKIVSGNLNWSGGEYTGYFNSFFFEGAGTLICQNGDIKKGNWSKSKLNGPCEVLFQNKTVFKGHFINDLLEGNAFIDTPLYTYTGFVKESLPEGEGKILFKLQNSEYSGQFISGVINGRGVYKTEQDVFKGEFVHGKMTGKGEKTFSDKAKYVGEFSDSLMQGRGVLRFSYENKKGVYSGEFKLNKFHGNGRLKIGEKEYKGEFANGELHGSGDLTLDKIIFKGGLTKNEISTKGIVQFFDGSYYSGEFLSQVPFGSGEALDSNGYWIASNFIDGKPTTRHKLKSEFFENLQDFKNQFSDFTQDLEWINLNFFSSSF